MIGIVNCVAPLGLAVPCGIWLVSPDLSSVFMHLKFVRDCFLPDHFSKRAGGRNSCKASSCGRLAEVSRKGQRKDEQ